MAAKQGHASAQFNLGVSYANGEGVPRDPVEAAKWWSMAAKQGYASAQYRLGTANYFAEGIPQNYVEAAKWWLMAAKQGYAWAQFNLGLVYARGEGVPRDPVEAAKWWLMAAKQGHASAQYRLGVAYANGEGVPRDPVEAEKYFRLAAEQQHADAQIAVGEMYLAQDPTEAANWYKRAAEEGNAIAQFELSEMYRRGYGVVLDPAEARRWLRKAAGQGYASAQSNLGSLYVNGEGVPKSAARAASFYEMAAKQGLAQAQFYLGTLYVDAKSSNPPIFQWIGSDIVGYVWSTHWDDLESNNSLATLWLRRFLDTLKGRGSDSKLPPVFGKFLSLAQEHIDYLRTNSPDHYAHGLYLLGRMHQYGTDGLAKDQRTAKPYFREAASFGDEYAIRFLVVTARPELWPTDRDSCRPLIVLFGGAWDDRAKQDESYRRLVPFLDSPISGSGVIKDTLQRGLRTIYEDYAIDLEYYHTPHESNHVETQAFHFHPRPFGILPYFACPPVGAQLGR